MCTKEVVSTCKEVSDSNLIKLAKDLKEKTDRKTVKNMLEDIKNILEAYDSYRIECLKDRCSYLLSFLNESDKDILWNYESMNINAFVAEIMRVLDC